MKLDPYMYHLSTFIIPNNDGVNEWVGGGLQPKNHQKLRESRLKHHLKPV